MDVPRHLPGAAALLSALVAGTPARAAEVLVAVAANFAEVVSHLDPEFERRTGHTLLITTGSTGKLYAQIVSGAPFHVLLSADAATPARLEREGLAVSGTRFTYAIGALALWSRDPARIGGDGPAVLRDGDFRHLALANPDLAPYGVAARETMQSLGVWDGLASKLVMGENVGQVHSMVATGNAELGFVALSALRSPRTRTTGSLWEVPQRLHAPIRQDAVLLRAGAGNPGARAFLDHLGSASARAVIRAHGYSIDAPR